MITQPEPADGPKGVASIARRPPEGFLAKGDAQMAEYRRLDLSEVGEVTVVRFRDHKIIEDLAIQELGQELFQLVEVDRRRRLLLNFSSVDFLSSAALGKLITLDRKVKAHGGTLKLSNIRPEIYDVFNITKLDRLFDIKEDEADALAAF
jgi:anti-sigma B factor antagonist